MAGRRVRHHGLRRPRAASRPWSTSTARQLLWAQAIAANETTDGGGDHGETERLRLRSRHSIKQNEPGVYPLFQGKQWTTRLEIGFAALFAALAAGLLVLLIAITLIVLKLGFLLLLVAGPFFLIVGTHPGFGRVIALRWAEMLIGVLLKTAAIALGAQRSAVCLLADHGRQRRRTAVGAEDPDDLAGHGGRVHLPQAVRPPVLGRGIRVIGSRERAEASLGDGREHARRNTASTPRRWAFPASPATGRA